MFPIVPAGDVYRDVVASGGQIDTGFIPFWLGLVTATGLVPPAYTTVDPASGVGTLLQHAGGAFAFQGPTIADAVTGGDKAYDGSFYQLRSPLSVVDKVKVPTFVDRRRVRPLPARRADALPAAARQRRAEPAADRSVDAPAGLLRRRVCPPGTLPSLDDLSLRWFDQLPARRPDTALDTDVKPVNYYEIGSGSWRTAPGWLPSDVHAKACRLDRHRSPGHARRADTGDRSPPRRRRRLPGAR